MKCSGCVRGDLTTHFNFQIERRACVRACTPEFQPSLKRLVCATLHRSHLRGWRELLLHRAPLRMAAEQAMYVCFYHTCLRVMHVSRAKHSSTRGAVENV